MENIDQQISALSPEQQLILQKRLRQRRLSSEKNLKPSGIEISQREKYCDLPTSFAQQRLWLFQQLNPDSSAYNIFISLYLEGQLNVAVLEKVFTEIIRRHESLRTAFITNSEGQPIQVIAPAQPTEIPIVDLELAPNKEREVQRLARAEAQQPFDLKQSSLRITLLQLEQTAYVLFITTHHIISDRWSIGILVQEIKALYEAFSNEQISPLSELPIQYVDWAIWQRQYLKGEVLEAQVAYWKRQLANLPVLDLPSDRPRPAIPTYQGAKQFFELSQDVSDALKALGINEGVTLFTVLLAAFKVLLHKYTNQNDIVVGTDIANRNRAKTERLIGFLINTLVLRTNLSGNPTFRQLLSRVRQVTLGAYDHQDLSFDKLVDVLNPERDLSQMLPLVQVKFDLQLAKIESLEELSDLKVSPLMFDNETTKFELRFNITEIDEVIKGLVEYSTDLFDAATIARMVRHFQKLLESIVSSPEQRLSDLAILTEAERYQLLISSNGKTTAYPTGKCIAQLFEEQVERTPDAIALVFEHQQLTYRQLNQQANQLAHYLRSLRVDSEVLVGICLEPSLELVVSLLAVLKASGVYVPLDPNYPQKRLAFMLEDANVRVLLTQESLTEKITPQQTHIVFLDRDRNTIARESVENPDCQATLDDLAYAIYTSGSTGKPKAVLGKIRGVVNRLHWMWDTLPFGADEICCQKTSINFVDHVAEIFSPLLKGIPLVIVPGDMRGDILRLMSLLGDKRITRLVVVPSLLKAMVDNAPLHLTNLRYLKYVFCSGEALSLTLAEAFHQKLSSARVFNLYGSSEVAADVTCFEVNFWEIRQRILQYFKPEVVHGDIETQVLGAHQKPFTKPGVSPEMLAIKFQRSELPSYPLTVDDYYDQLSREVLPYAIDTGSPTFIGHMTSALPDFMHDMSKLISRLNQNLVKVETSKSLIFLEREAIAILHRLFYGFSSKFYEENIQQNNRNLGIVTTGGTTANISALLCARNSKFLCKEDSGELSTESLYKVLSKRGYHDIVILGSRLMHYSINKAASMLGLGTDNIVFIDSNDDGELDLDLLKEKICECKRNKLHILALVGIAGTTETGEIDPLFEMGDVAQESDIHFHVDAAWGGATIFSEKHRRKLQGIDKADSITICGHKQLYLPQGISVCLFKDPQMLNFAETTARYQAQRDTFDVGRFTIEGSRSAISLCLHGALHIIGKRGYEFLIDSGIEKAQYFARLIELLEPFDLVMEPALNIVNYRYIPEDLRAKAQQKSLSDDDIQTINQLNTQIQREQFEQGLTFVSKTTLMDNACGKGTEIVVFRAVLSNPNTTAADLQRVLEDQLRIANQIEARSREKLDGLNHLPLQRIGSEGADVALVSEEAIHLQLMDALKADSGEALEDYLKKNTIPIGKPISNTQIYILDKFGNLLPPGIVGEIHVGGDGLAKGYLNLPELTQEKFIPNPFATVIEIGKKIAEERLYRTGDLARWLPDGNIECLGRIDHQVKIRGFRIELGEIEAILAQHPGVRKAVVLARQDEPDNKKLVAYVVSHPEPAFEVSELRHLLKEKLPGYMIPSAFVMLEALPLLPNGKVNHRALPSPEGIRPKLEAAYQAPQTEVEQTIADIWQKVLHIEEVGIHDNFFDLGGHSLLLVQVHSKLQEIFQRDFPLLGMFQYPTIGHLAQYLSQEPRKEKSSKRSGNRGDSIKRRKQVRQKHRSQ